MKRKLILGIGVFTFFLGSFSVSKVNASPACTVCAIHLNDATMRIEEDGCYCIGYGSSCRFEGAGSCPAGL